MKQTTKVLLSAVLTIALCLSVISGATFALFTDEAQTNIAVTAGTVDVEANIVDDSLTLYSMEKKQDGRTFENGGTAAFTDVDGVSKKLDLTNVTPGDKAEFKINVTNSSNVAIKYRLTWTVNSKMLSEELEASVGEVVSENTEVTYEKLVSGTSGWVDWAIPDPNVDGDESKTLAVKIELPVHVGDEYQGAQAAINFKVEAVQANGTEFYKWDSEVDTSWYNDAYTDFEISTASELAGLSQLAFDGNNFGGKTIKLVADIDLSGQTWTPIKSFAGEFDGNGKTISNFVIDETSGNGGLFGTIEAGEGERVHDLTIQGVDATVGDGRFGTLANSVKGIVNRVTVTDVEVTTTSADAWVGGMCAFMNWPWMNDCTVENMVVDATSGAEFVAGFSPILQKNSNMVFNNCDVKGFKVTVSDTDGSCGVGGFVGQTQRGWENPKMTNCDVSGIDIVASGTVDIGGFMPWPGAHTIAENCTTEGKIDASGVTGADNFIGGFFGNLGWNADLGQMGHVLTSCTADVDIISGGASAGGFVGSATVSGNGSMYATFNNCSATGDVTNTNGIAGGFAGVADRGDYNNCSASGAVTGTVAGGFIGQIKDVTPKYDHRYPAGTREYLVDEIFIDDCTGSENHEFIARIDEGTDVTVTIDGVEQ